MKGLIALVLVLMMTGMVTSQQPQSTRFGTGKLNDPANSKLLAKYLLVMSRDVVQGLKNQGYLQAPIDLADQADIDHVVFHGSVSNSLRTDLEPHELTQTASSGGDGRLEFKLDDSLIAMMQRQGLRYILPSEDRGTYREVLVVYDPPSRQSRPTQSNPDRFASRLTEPSNSAGGRQPFVGPVVPDNFFDDRTDRVRELQSRGEQSFTPRISSMAPRRNSTINENLVDRSSAERATGLNRQFSDDFSRQRLAEPTANREFQRDAIRTRTGSRNAWELEDNTQVAGYENRAGTQSLADPVLAPRIARSDMFSNTRENRAGSLLMEDRQRELQLQRQRLENANLIRQLDDERYINARRERELDREYRSQVAADAATLVPGNREFRDTYRTNTRAPIERPIRRYPAQEDLDYGNQLIVDSRPRESYASMPDRNAAVPRPSNKPPAFAINGPNDRELTDGIAVVGSGTTNAKLIADAKRIQNQSRALWFIMLCSVGLNLYLSVIARSFYVRYEELADDLRESFTSSV